MANINLSQESYIDYVGSKFFAALGVQNITFTPKYAPATEKNPVPAILVHCSGVQEETGVIVNFDMWPRYDFEDADLATFFTKKTHTEPVLGEDGKPTVDADGNEITKEVFDGYLAKGNLADIHFRIGYWVETDGKEKTVREGKPKWLAYVSNGKVCKLGGESREFNGSTI